MLSGTPLSHPPTPPPAIAASLTEINDAVRDLLDGITAELAEKVARHRPQGFGPGHPVGRHRCSFSFDSGSKVEVRPVGAKRWVRGEVYAAATDGSWYVGTDGALTMVRASDIRPIRARR